MTSGNNTRSSSPHSSSAQLKTLKGLMRRIICTEGLKLRRHQAQCTTCQTSYIDRENSQLLLVFRQTLPIDRTTGESASWPYISFRNKKFLVILSSFKLLKNTISYCLNLKYLKTKQSNHPNRWKLQIPQKITNKKFTRHIENHLMYVWRHDGGGD